VSAKAWWKESSTHYEWRRNGLVLEVQADPYWEWSARVELEPVSVELSGECLADTAEQAKADAVRKLRAALEELAGSAGDVAAELGEPAG
jgi:hypothetical protein